MKNTFLTITFSIIVGLSVPETITQCNEWKWPTNKVRAEECNRIYIGAFQKGNYKDALDPHQWLFANAPIRNISLDPNNKSAFAKIGDLYSQSFGECAKKENQAVDRTVYLLAYDYYIKANESEKM